MFPKRWIWKPVECGVKNFLAQYIVSVIIVSCLVHQGMATFTTDWRFYSFYYPFLNYPMYSGAHFKGDRINVRHLVFAIFEDSTEQEITPDDLGLNFWKFEWGFRYAIMREDQEQLKIFLRSFLKNSRLKIESLRLENYRLVLTDKGAEPAPPDVIKTLRLEF